MMGNLKILELKVGEEVGVAAYSHRWGVHVEKVIKVTATQIVTQIQHLAIEGVHPAYQSEPKRFDKETGRERTQHFNRAQLWSMDEVREFQAQAKARQETTQQVDKLDSISWTRFTDEQRAQILALVESFKEER